MNGYIFDRRTDLWAFGAPAAASILLVLIGQRFGLLQAEVSPGIWLMCILGVDVAHVWSTTFRVYFIRSELAKRPVLYFGTPLIAFLVGGGLHAYSTDLFWRVLAYAAVWHFVRQQFGWVALYQRRERDLRRFDYWIDRATIYTATLYPLLWWHVHLPRDFAWFVPGDFVQGVGPGLLAGFAPLHYGLLTVFVLRQVIRFWRGNPPCAGKLLVLATTVTCWHVGIISLNSDYAFTVTNVLIHGVPYMVLTYRYAREQGTDSLSLAHRITQHGWWFFGATILVLAAMEEWQWHLWVYGDRAWLFGPAVPLTGTLRHVAVGLLITPQLTHYVLDAFVWKVRPSNRWLAQRFTLR